MRIAIHRCAITITWILALAVAPSLFAVCTLNLQVSNIDPFHLSATADAHSGVRGGIGLSIGIEGVSGSDTASCDNVDTCHLTTPPISIACMPPGKHHIVATANCYLDSTATTSYEFTVDPPTVSGSFRQDTESPNQQKGWIDVVYSLPDTETADQRSATVTVGGVNITASPSDLPTASGVWHAPVDFTCYPEGSYKVQLEVVGCGRPDSTALNTTTVDVQGHPTVNVLLNQTETGTDSEIWAVYNFPNTGARSIDVYEAGFNLGHGDESTGIGFSGTFKVKYPTTCLTGTHTILAQVKACGSSDPRENAQDSEQLTIDSKPTVSVSAGALDPATNSYPITVGFNFKNTDGPGVRRLDLYQNGVYLYGWTANLPLSGSVSYTTQGCGEVAVVATACNPKIKDDPAFVTSATTQLPDDLCKADRSSCGMPGRPVNWGSGDVSLVIPVVSIAQTPLPLYFDLAYHSERPVYPSLAREIAPGWTHTFNQTLRIIDATRIYGVDETGLERLYKGSYPTWTCAVPADVHETVTQSGNQLLLKDLSGTVRAFDAASGRWLSTTDRWNNAITATYDAGGNLTAVTDSIGRVITIVAAGTSIQQMTLPNGAVWKFQYGSNGTLTSIFDPLHTGGTAWRTFSYQTSSTNEPRLLTAMRDDGGFLLEGHSYDGQDRGLTSFLENNREMVALEYDQPSPGQTRITHTIDASTSQLTIVTWQYIAGRYRALRIDGGCGSCGIISDTETREYDASGNPITITHADGSVTRQTFDTNGRLLTRTEASGTPLERTRSYEYGLASWLDFVTRVTEPAPIGNLVTTFTWSGVADPQPNTSTTLTTSTTGKLAAGASDTTLTTTTTYDSRHRVVSSDGPRTDVPDITSFSYFSDNDTDINRRGRQSSVTTALGMTQYHDSYDLYGTPTVTRDVNNVSTTLDTDLRGRTLDITSQPVPGNPSESVAYRRTFQFDSRDRLTDVTSAGGNHTRYDYEDGTNLPLDTITLDGSGNERERRHFTRNVIGSVVQEDEQSCQAPASPCSSWTTARTEQRVYDFHNRLAQVIHGDQSKKLFFYDAMGRVIQEQDETHTSPNTTYAFDLLGRTISVTRVIGASNAVTSYGYSLDGSLLTITDPNSNITRYAYDDFGRLTSTTSPVTGVSTIAYDAAGNRITTADANGAVTQTVYDALNRPTQRTSTRNGSSETVSWTYDTGAFGVGRFASMTDPSGTTLWSYERRGLITSEQKSIGAATYTTTYGYDPNGNRTSIGYPSGRIVNYTFDYAARPYSVSSGSTSIVTSATYLPFGPLSQINFGNGTTQTMAFDNRYMITENKLTSPSATIADYLYAHNGAGDITQIHDSTDASYNRDFGYDDLHRLVTANTGSSLWGNGAYSYDAMGNMTSLALGNSRSATFNYNGTTPLLSSVTENGTSRTVTYDAAGNEASVGSGTFSYSPRNRLSAGDGYSYLYDGNGLRTVAAPTTPLQSISVSPATVTGGAATTLTVSLSAPAPAGGLSLSLTSDNASVIPPASATVAEGTTSTTVTVNTGAVSQSTLTNITALAGADRRVTNVTIQPPIVASVALSSGSITGGTSVTGTLTINGPAPAAGISYPLSSTSTAATVPATVTVAAGATSANFTVATSAVATSTSATIASGSNQAALTVQAAVPAGVSFNPTQVIAGRNSTGTITLNGPAEAGGATATLSGGSAVTVPASVAVPAGAASATFTATTNQVASSTQATVTATVHGTSANGTLQVAPLIPSSLTLQPGALVGSHTSTGTLVLNASAPASGIDVALSSDTTAATVPATVHFAAGVSSMTFTVATSSVSTRVVGHITATLNGASTAATLLIETSSTVPPIANFFFNCSVLTCTFDGSLTTDSENRPLTYNWYNGSTFMGSGINLPYTFPSTGTYDVTLQVTDDVGVAAAPITRRALPTSDSSIALRYWSTGKPCRIYDSRYVGSGQKIASGTTVQIPLAGSPCTIPAGAQAIIFNLTSYQPTGQGYARAWSYGVEPLAVALTFVPTLDPETAVTTVRLSSPTQVLSLKPTVFPPPGTAGAVHLIVDVIGFYVDSSAPTASCAPGAACGPMGFKPLPQCRAFDSRVTPPRIEAGATRTITVTNGNCGISPSLLPGMALSMNVSAIPTGSGNLVVYDSALSPTDVTASVTMTYHSATRAESNGTVVRIGSRADHTSEIAIGARVSATDVVLDVGGVFAMRSLMPDGLAYYPLQPCRAFDSRVATYGSNGRIRSGTTTNVQIAGNCGVPRGARAVVAYTTAINPAATGYLREFPAGTSVPMPVTLLYQAGDSTMGNSNIIELGTTQQDLAIAPWAGGTDPTAPLDLAIDIVGYFAADPLTVSALKSKEAATSAAKSTADQTQETTESTPSAEEDVREEKRPIVLSFTGDFASTAASNGFVSIYSPEARLLSEAGLSSSAQPAIQQEYVWLGNRPIGQFDRGELRWTVADHLGAPLLQVGAATDVSWRGEYEPYGSIRLRAGQSLRQPLRFHGQEASDDSDREYNVFRWYRAAWGRYTQADPIGLDGGIDEYVYADDTPTTLDDPLGLAPKGAKKQSALPPPVDCDAVCATAYKLADSDLKSKGGTVVCSQGQKCPCVFDNAFSVRGECPDLDANIMDHETKHLEESECKSKALCLAEAKPMRDVHRIECMHRAESRDQLLRTLSERPNIAPSCRQKMLNMSLSLALEVRDMKCN